MMRYLWLLLLLLCACGAAPKPLSPAAGAPSGPAAPSDALRFRLPGYDFSAVFPAKPTASTGQDDGLFSTTLSADGPQVFNLAAFSTQGQDRIEDAKWFEMIRGRMKLEKRGDVQLGSSIGVELGGPYEQGFVLARLYALGDTLFLAECRSKSGKLDEASALRFLNSVELDLSFRIYASATTKFSVMVPAHAIELDKSERDDERRTMNRAFYVGGKDELIYWVGAWEVPDRTPEVTDDMLLDGVIDYMKNSGQYITWQAPVDAGGARGRDFLASDASANMMGRLVSADRFVYLLMLSAKSRAALQTADPAKFYASLVWH